MRATGPVFYTYIYLNPLKEGSFTYDDLEFNLEPFYIGKGFGTRFEKHIWLAKNFYVDGNKHKLNTIKKILNENLEPIIVFYKKDITNEEASNIEKELILKIGRKDLKRGPLTNMTDGGDGAPGLVHSKETKIKISKNCNNAGKNNPRYGKEVSTETREKIRNGNLGKKYSKEINSKKASPAEKNPMYKKTVYSVWLNKFGKDVADEKYKQWKENISKNSNKKSLHDIWIEKYGKEIADLKKEEMIQKMRKKKQRK